MHQESICNTSVKEEVLNETVGALLLERGMNVSLAESCTGGQVMKCLSDVPGSSRYLAGGVVSYSNDLKINLLGVSRDIIEQYGAVSEQTARLMAEGVKKITGTSLGVGITGIAGPDGGTEQKPIGLVYIAVAGEVKTICQRNVFRGQRSEVRSRATSKALEMLRQYLLDVDNVNYD